MNCDSLSVHKFDSAMRITCDSVTPCFGTRRFLNWLNEPAWEELEK